MSFRENGFRHRLRDNRLGQRNQLDLRKQPRTISDDLRDREIAKITRVEQVRYGDRDPMVHGAPDFVSMGNGCGRRVPVRHE